MKVEICLYASLSSRLPEKSNGNCFIKDIDENTTIGTILSGLNIRPDEPKLILVNGIHSKPEASLKEGDRLAVFPPIAGG
jgi:sulfur-carrier protein